MNRLLPTLALLLLVCVSPVFAGCGGESSPPNPREIMRQALAPANLKRALPDAVVRVQSLGYRDRILEQREVPVPRPLLKQLKGALGDARAGLAGLVRSPAYRGIERIAGRETDRVTGRIDRERLIRAASRSAAAGRWQPGLSERALKRGLAGAGFDLYATRPEHLLERLDLTVSLDDPDNASPPARIRFSLTERSVKTSP